MRRSGRLAQAFARFYRGRYGVDPFSRFLCVACLALLLLALLIRGVDRGSVSVLLCILVFLLLLWVNFRTLSRNYTARQRENWRYMKTRTAFLDYFRGRWERFRQRKDYAFFRCPGCRQVVRVPRGKGKLRITCRRCGYTFDKKT